MRLLFGSLLAAALFAAQPAGAQLPNPIKIGVLNDQSGPFGDQSGRGSVVAAQLAAEDFMREAPGQRVEIVYGDHQNKPDIGSAIVWSWVDREGVAAVADAVNSSVALAVNDVLRQRHRAFVATNVGTSDLTGKFCAPTTVQWTFDTWAFGNSAARTLKDVGPFYFVGFDYALGAALERDATAVIVAGGGRVLGRVTHSVQETDFSSLLLQAQSSGAKVVALTSVGTNTINQIKQAREFGLVARGQRMAGFLIFLTDIHGIGLDAAQGLNVVAGFYWDQNEQSRAFSRRFFEQHRRMPTKQQAATYASVTHFLKAAVASGSVDGAVVNQQMRAMPVDYFGRAGSIRPDGRVLYDVTLYEVKAPGESRHPWDYYKPVRTLPKETAFRPPGADGCTLVGPA